MKNIYNNGPTPQSFHSDHTKTVPRVGIKKDRCISSIVKHSLLFLTVLLLAPLAANADTFHVATNGCDDATYDGRTVARAWASLAFACERVPEGAHTILVGSGEFIATQTAKPKSGVLIVGSGSNGDKASRIVAAKDWPLANKLQDMGPPEEYLIALVKAKGVTVHDLLLCSIPEHRITGAVYCHGSQGVRLERLVVRDFRWNGLALEYADKLIVRHCLIQNASTEKLQHNGGLIRTHWIKDSEIGHNRLVSTIGKGYGYKASGHENVRLHHNHIDVAGEFAIESAHENEFGVEIDHNYLNRCISVPKGGQGADPKQRGCDYSFWIHHNLMTDSYAVEGPRNHLRLDHNYIRCEKPNGRIFTHHGGINHGPVWIDHNIIENADRAFIWMNQGLAENIHAFNNTIVFANAGDRAGSVLGAGSGERLNGWLVKSNIFIAPVSQPRRLMTAERGVSQEITATDNICVNITDAPPGNHIGVTPVLNMNGAKPLPFYAPSGVVGCGAVELGETKFEVGVAANEELP